MKKTLFLLTALVTGVSLQAAIDLAAGGKTEYVIVAPANPTSEETEAVKDLRWHLNYITDAKFRIAKAGAKNIFVGTKAPSDNKPLSRYERRIRNEKGNIYLYGNGIQGNTFAVYDFLEQYLGCQWYSFYGDMKIKKQKTVSFDENKLKKDIRPSFHSFSYKGHIFMQDSIRVSAFRRRGRIYDSSCPIGAILQPMTLGHVPSQLIPSGYVKPGARKPVNGPHRYFEDKKYFETNPEFFSLWRNGKRSWEYQLCYSNPELRKELIKNYQIIIDRDYKGGEGLLHIDLNDKGKYGMPVCYCKECAELNKKYGDPAGSYYDAVIEITGHFLDKYPKIRFQMTAYQLTREVPSKFKGKFPANILVRIAALDETNFLKPYRETHTADRMYQAWSKVSGGDLITQFYPTVYPRPLFTRPLVANINRLVQNMYYLHELGFTNIDSEFGNGASSSIGFNDMRVYIISRLATDIKLDVNALIEDFMLHYYGEKAAPIMLKFYRELEECEKNEKRFMRWWPDHRSCLTYLTPENILRWQGYFDEMLKVSDPKSRQYLNIRRARQTLDEATLSIWYKFAPGQMPDRKMIFRRHQRTFAADIRDRLRTQRDKKAGRERIRGLIARHGWRPIYYHYALAGEWKPLPEPFASMPKDKVLRTVPYINRKPLRNDPEAVVGIAAFNQEPPKEFTFTSARWEWTNIEKRELFTKKIKLADVKKKKGYNFYHIGSTRLYPDMNIYFSMIYAGGVTLGYLYDEKNPEQIYDIYVSIKYDHKKKMLLSDQVILVKKDGKGEKLKQDNEQRINDAGQFA